jgi:hypothetical protein
MAKINVQMWCANCDETFSYGTRCPVCGSMHIHPIGRWLSLRDEPEQARTGVRHGCPEMVAAWAR